MLDGLDVDVVENPVEITVIPGTVIPVIVPHFAAWCMIPSVDLNCAGAVQAPDEGHHLGSGLDVE